MRRCMHVAGWGLLLATGLAFVACEANQGAGDPPPRADARPLELETAYSGQVLPPEGSAYYRFHAPYRGAYLIVLSHSTTATAVTIEHPKKTCLLEGNGSCELISSPDRDYTFSVRETGGEGLAFTLSVTHWDGTGAYEGQVGDPVPLEVGRVHRGTVGIHEISYYRFRTGGGGEYTIRLAEARSDLYWRLFDRGVFDVILYGCDEYRVAREESCRVGPLEPDTDYYLLVAERSGVPGGYTLSVTP